MASARLPMRIDVSPSKSNCWLGTSRKGPNAYAMPEGRVPASLTPGSSNPSHGDALRRVCVEKEGVMPLVSLLASAQMLLLRRSVRLCADLARIHVHWLRVPHES